MSYPSFSSDPVYSLRTLRAHIDPLRRRVAEHAIYARLLNVPNLRRFMAQHVFAVWDFMSLLKLLQRRLTCVTVPWLPAENADAARAINSIVLGEESDEIAPGVYASHFDLYLRAMDEVEADSRAIRAFVAALRAGARPGEAIEHEAILPSTRRFVLDDLAMADAPTHVLAAAFLLGREDIVPSMFAPILRCLDAQRVPCPSFRLYLARHIVLDADEHAPLAEKLLLGVCGDDARRWQAATDAAELALAARMAFWDGLTATLDEADASLSRH